MKTNSAPMTQNKLTQQTQPERYTNYRQIVTAIAQASISGRMVIVAVWPGGEGDEVRFDAGVYPVLAIQSLVVQFFRKTDSVLDKANYATAAELLKAGYSFQGEQIDQNIIYFDDNLGVSSMMDDPIVDPPSQFATMKQVLCNWPPHEDEARLKPIIDKLRTSATERFIKALRMES